MEFSVVKVGYDQIQVDSCLADLNQQLARMAAQAEAAAKASAEIDLVRGEIDRLRGMLIVEPQAQRRPGRTRNAPAVASAEAEAAEILARARDELTAAREEARLVRDQVYAEALQARRDFEAALHARRQREQQVDEILSGVAVVPVPAEPAPPATVTAPTGVPATRVAAGDHGDRTSPAGEVEDLPAESPVVPAEDRSTAHVR
jgi:hypothetical protein